MSTAGRRRGALYASGLAALALAGCGDDEGSSAASPASLVPADALIYAEGAVRPEGDQLEAIEAIAARFPGGEDLGELIVPELDASFAEGSEEGESVTWTDDIEPWLGERAGFYLSGVEPDPETGEPPFALLLDTKDLDAAEEAMPKLAAIDSSSETQREAGDVTYYVDDDGTTAGVVSDRVVAATTEDTFLDVVDVAAGEAEPLVDSEDFSYEVAGTDASDALGFASLELRPLLEAAIAADPSAGLSTGQFEELYEDLGFSLDEPVRFAVNADEAAVTFDSTMGSPDIFEKESAAAGELLGSLPADSSLAGICQGCLESFGVSFQLGVTEAAAEDGATPEQAQSALRERLGLDPKALFDALGPAVFFARGSSVFDLSGAVVIGVKDKVEVERGLDAVATVIRSEAAGARVEPLPPGLPPGATGFSVAPGDVPVAVNAVLVDDRLVVAFGEEATLDAIEADETLTDSGRLDEVASRLGEGFEPIAFADLDSLFGLITSAAATDPSVAEAEPYLEPFAGLVAGYRADGELSDSRLIIEFD